MIQYTKHIKNIEPIYCRSNVSYLKIDKTNYELYSDLIKNSIQLFNSEIEWNDMWDYEESVIRFNNNHIMYIMIENNSPLGYVWYDKNYLYNTFVTKNRIKGDSQNFINYTLYDIKTKYTTIQCQCDDWNIRAQEFFKGIGFSNPN